MLVATINQALLIYYCMQKMKQFLKNIFSQKTPDFYKNWLFCAIFAYFACPFSLKSYK